MALSNSFVAIQDLNQKIVDIIKARSDVLVHLSLYTHGNIYINPTELTSYYKIKIYDYKEIQKDKYSIEMRDHILKVDDITAVDREYDTINIQFDGRVPILYSSTVFHGTNCQCIFNPLDIDVEDDTLIRNYIIARNIKIEDSKHKNAINYIDSIEMRNPRPSPYRISLPDTSGNFIMVISKVKDA